jgi:UDP-N-acetylmuramoyl-tripeptide--D-alanyl-D-alanine ligase
MIKEIHDKFLKCTTVCTDTRNIILDSMFFALKGEAFDGNKYAKFALENGCKYCIIDNPEYKINDSCILVENTLKTMQELATFHRKFLKIPIISITGTNGKTTTKELINAILSKKYTVVATKGNLNNHIGVPLTLLSMNFETEIGIVEMGANHPYEIKQLCNIAEPDFGLITNIGKAHIEGFGSFEGVKNTKKELYDYLFEHNKTIFVKYDNEILKQIVPDTSLIKYGNNETFVVAGISYNADPLLKIKWKTKNISTQLVNTNLIGSYNYENVLASIAVGIHFNVEISQINKALEEYIPSNNRSQVKETENNTLILDAYNANPTSMKASLENLAQINHPNKIAIIGDMLELGDVSIEEHLSIINLLSKIDVNQVILVGKIFNSLNIHGYKSFENTNLLIESLKENPLKASLVLIKASRGIRLETIVDYL